MSAGPREATPDAGPPEGTRRHFVVCGDNPLAYRLVTELVTRYDAAVTSVVASVRANWAPRIREVPGVMVLESETLDRTTLQRAGVASASALALASQGDADNIDAALLAQELNPGLRIVIRMSNRNLGRHLDELLNNSVALSASSIAAPAFVAAALDDATSAPMRIADSTFVVTDRERARPEDVVCGLAVVAGREDPLKLPDEERLADLVLARSTPAPPPRPPRRQRTITIRSVLGAPRLRYALLALLGFFVTATSLLAWWEGLSWGEAAYVALLAEIGGADSGSGTTPQSRVLLAVLTIVSIALIPALTAAVVDSVIKARLRAEAGRLNRPITDHIVVVGLGEVGTRVVRALREEGVDIVAIERNPQARGVPIAKDLGIPVVIGDATRPEVLQAASVKTCRALVIVSTDDVANLETGLLARVEKPDLRIVMRLFDGDFADRVQRAFAINASRSVSYLAAPAFAAAMLGREVLHTIPVNRRVLLIGELPIGADSDLEHRPVGSVDLANEVRLLAVRTAEGVLWRPPTDRPLRRDEHIVVAATRLGLSRLMQESAERVRPVAPASSHQPPWQLPHPAPPTDAS